LTVNIVVGPIASLLLEDTHRCSLTWLYQAIISLVNFFSAHPVHACHSL
jgi:hypothetical protein